MAKNKKSAISKKTTGNTVKAKTTSITPAETLKSVNSEQLPEDSKPSLDNSTLPITDSTESLTDKITAPVLKIEAGKTYFTKSNHFLKVLERDGDIVHYELYTLNNKKAVEGRITSSIEKLNGDILHLVDTETELSDEATNTNHVSEGGEKVFVKLSNNQEFRAVLFSDKLVFEDGKTVENPELAELIEKGLYKVRTY